MVYLAIFVFRIDIRYVYLCKPANIFVCEGALFGRETDGYFSIILLQGCQFGKGPMILLAVRTWTR